MEFSWKGKRGESFQSRKVESRADLGSSGFLVHVAKDATEESRLRKDLALVTTKFERILSLLDDPVVALNGNGVIEAANEAFASMVKSARPELCGLELSQLIMPTSMEGFMIIRERPDGQASARRLFKQGDGGVI
ncbi:PAS domain-containing protein, partial [Kitasatospora sp. NPDC058243]|uniref:PAS domain-containing protein n=1 Tax=Kitasatospora sp. NPDC058243 TaxID=3346397 RepID=UPI0036DF166C